MFKLCKYFKIKLLFSFFTSFIFLVVVYSIDYFNNGKLVRRDVYSYIKRYVVRFPLQLGTYFDNGYSETDFVVVFLVFSPSYWTFLWYDYI